MAKHIKIGMITEDKSDFDCLKIFIKKLCPKKALSFSPQYAGGSGAIKGNCSKWAKVFFEKGCTKLVIVQDSDGKSATKIKAEIQIAVNPCPISSNVIVVPIIELENWLLADTGAIHKRFSKAKKLPKQFPSPENIQKGKEALGKFIKDKYEQTYLNTTHNAQIAEKIDIGLLIKKCPSFVTLSQFAKSM